MTAQNPNDNSILRERLLELDFEIWRDDIVTDGEVAPTEEKMISWHGRLRDGHPDAGKIRNPSVKRRTRKVCQRLRRGLDPAFDPSTELHRITLPIALFVIELNEVKPFDSAWGSIECLAIHAACKFAGCAPPDELGGKEWDRIVLRETKTLTKAQRSAALAQILYERIARAMDA
jgi:hypothetical protein